MCKSVSVCVCVFVCVRVSECACMCVCVCTLTAQYLYSSFLLNLLLLYLININLDNWVLKWKGPDKSAWGTCTPHDNKNHSSSSSSSSSSGGSSGGGRGGMDGRILLCLIDFGRAKDTRLESYSSLLQPCKKGTSTDIGVDDVSNRGRGIGVGRGKGRGVGVECHEDHRSKSSEKSSSRSRDKDKDRVKEMKRGEGLLGKRRDVDGELRRSRRNDMEEKIHVDSENERGEGKVEGEKEKEKEGEVGDRQGEGENICDARVGHPKSPTKSTLLKIKRSNRSRNENALTYDITVVLERGTYVRTVFY